MQVVLLVSGDASLGESLRGMLGDAAVVPRQPDVDHACARLQSLRPDAIAYDAGHSLDTSGLARLRAAAGPAPIGVLTSRDDALAEASFLRAGAALVLRKPFGESDARALLENRDSNSLSVAVNGAGAVDHLQPDLYARALRWFAGGLMEAHDEIAFCHEFLRAIDDLVNPLRCGMVLDINGVATLAAQRGLRPDVVECWETPHQRRLLATMSIHPAAAWRGNDARPDVVRVMDLLDLEAIIPVLRHGEAGAVLLLGGPGSGSVYPAATRELVTLMARMASRRLEECRAMEHGRLEGALLNEALAEAPVGLIVLDARHTVVASNATARELLDLGPQDAAGLPLQRLGSRLADLVLGMNGHKVSERRRMRRPAASGEIEAQVAVLPDGGRVIALQSAPELELPAEEAGKQEFWRHVAERVAQEIKNPMVAVNTFAQLLPRKYDSADFRETFSRVVQDEVARINRVVETLFRYAEEPRLNCEPQDVNLTVREALDDLVRKLPPEKLDISAALSSEPLSANIDTDAFHRVMEAIMQNAVDATPDGGRVKVETAQTPAGIEIRVEDGGKGIESLDARRVFDPFYSTKEQGMGMGLALAEKLMRAHAGSIDVERTASGAGQRFVVRLPALPAVAAAAGGMRYANDTRD
ncbi:MAG: hypothetical protein GC168_07825 [Candidatus Hydrogenedens sp.]|nr:hypothetical protein [Candidatus Hydrogenedens sp.]